MQNALKEISPAFKKFDPVDNGNLIAQQNISEKIKPFVSLKLFTANGGVNLVQDSLICASGQAIITYIIAGKAVYSDSTGKRGILKQDAWSWIITGTGAWCAMEPASADYLAIQLCIALTPALENSLPQSVYCDPCVTSAKKTAQILIGWHANDSGEFALPSLMNYLVVHLDSGKHWTYEIPVNHRLVWVFVVSGSLQTEQGEITPNNIALLNTARGKINMCAKADSIFVVGSTQEFMHELMFYKNSVHTSNEALRVGMKGIAELQRHLCIK